MDVAFNAQHDHSTDSQAILDDPWSLCSKSKVTRWTLVDLDGAEDMLS